MKKNKLCENCQGELDLNTWDNFFFEGKRICLDCFRQIRETLKTPFYINHIPDFVSGRDFNICKFKTEKELYALVEGKLLPNDILVYNKIYDDTSVIMSQNIKKEHWWVLGRFYNFKETLKIPKVNYNIYNKEKLVNQEKLNEWLDEKLIIRGR